MATTYGATSSAPAQQAGDAPPIDQMDVIPGYETYTAGQAPAPPQEASAPPPPREASQFNSSNVGISADQAKHFLISEADNHCCWGKKAANELEVTQIESRHANHYILKTYSEKRITEWRSEPFVGQIIDGPMNGRAPTPWEVYVQPPPPFTDSKIDMEVPHTASVKKCYHCHGHGKRDCVFCHHGHRDCTMCQGRNQQCSFCNGSGRQRCTTCHGHGHIECHNCRGTGSLKCYIVLRIHFKVHTNDYIQERSNTTIPSELVKKAGGTVLFEDQAARVWPFNNYPDEAINEASRRLVQDHSTRIGATERILMQSHLVRVVPVNECRYTFQNKTGQFYVYGVENLVYAPDYPHQCCCGCTVL